METNSLTFNGCDQLIEFIQQQRFMLYVRFGSALPISDIRLATPSTFKEGINSGAMFIPLMVTPILSTTSRGSYKNNKMEFKFVVPSEYLISTDLDISSRPYLETLSSTPPAVTALGLAIVKTNRRQDDRILSVMVPESTFTLAANINHPITYTLTLEV